MEEWVLNELLECSVCLDRLDVSSRVLPCQHTFCKKCLEEIVSTHKELRCPECRVLVAVKVDDLPPNILLTRILEGLKNTPAKTSPSNVPSESDSQSVNVTQLNQAAVNTQNEPQVHPTTKQQLTLPRAKALYDYTPQEPGDLAFRKGDVILLKKRIDTNWFHGELGPNQGFFPANFVQILEPLPLTSLPQCVALYDFRMREEDEKDCLTFNKGAVVTVIRRVDENWAEGRLGDRIGIFPISFVEMNSSAKHLMKSSMNFQPGIPSRSAPALPSTLTSTASSSSPATTVTTSSDSSPTSPSVSSSSRVSQREKRFSLNVNQQQQQQLQHRRSAEFQRNRYFPVTSSDPESQPLVPPTPGTTSPSHPVFTPPALYIALYPYKPQKPDELELRKGALYIVTEKCQDGWFKGTSVRTQKSGVFPGNYVQALRSQPHPQLAAPEPQPTRTSAVVNPPKLPTRTLNPPNISQLTSSSSSVPPAVVARLAVTPTPRPATAAVASGTGMVVVETPPPPAGPKKDREKEKEKSGPSLMKRLTGRKKSSQALLQPYSIDNPVFEDQTNGPVQESLLQPPQPNPVHMRSGSCPSQLLEIFGPERPVRERQSDHGSRHSMGGSQRLRSNRERPNILTAANSSLFTRSTPGIPGIPAATGTPTAATPGAAATAAATLVARDKESSTRKPKQTPVTWQRYRVLAPYPPNSEYELELRVGDVVYVHKKREDGWYKGTLERTGKTGLFPASFVESL